MGNEVMVYEGQMALTAPQIKAQKHLIQEVIKAVMKPDTHYGVIPGTKKNTLYKAGSEAILTTFRIAVDPVVEDLSTADCYRYRVTARGVLPSGEIVGSGIGEASTDEEKYRWRSAVCKEEFDATPEDRRRTKWNKGYGDKPAYSVNQIRTNPADLANTVLKMAKKRAQIDLTLTATAASDVFEQDLEDLAPELRDEIVGQRGQQGGKPSVTSPQSKSGNQQGDNGNQQKVGCITEAQAKMIFAKLKNATPPIPIESFMAHYSISRLGELPADMMKTALEDIESGVITAGEEQ